MSVENFSLGEIVPLDTGLYAVLVHLQSTGKKVDLQIPLHYFVKESFVHESFYGQAADLKGDKIFEIYYYPFPGVLRVYHVGEENLNMRLEKQIFNDEVRKIVQNPLFKHLRKNGAFDCQELAFKD